MNAPFLDRSSVTTGLAEIAERRGVGIVGLLPSDSVAHHANAQPVVLLGRKGREDLSLLDVCAAEIDLSDRLNVAVRILMQEELEPSAAGRKLLREAQSL